MDVTSRLKKLLKFASRSCALRVRVERIEKQDQERGGRFAQLEGFESHSWASARSERLNPSQLLLAGTVWLPGRPERHMKHKNARA